MGYESKVIVINRHELSAWITGTEETKVAGNEIARLEMSNTDAGFRKLFKETVDFNVFDLGADEMSDCVKITEDRYGEPLTYAPINSVIEWLERECQDKGKDTYRRYKVLLTLLKELVTYDWSDMRDNLVVVHYGH